MKTFKKTFLPKFITYNGRKYILTLDDYHEGDKHIKVEVLARNLRGKTDIHNKPYEPSKFIFKADSIGYIIVPMTKEKIENYPDKQ